MLKKALLQDTTLEVPWEIQLGHSICLLFMTLDKKTVQEKILKIIGNREIYGTLLGFGPRCPVIWALFKISCLVIEIMKFKCISKMTYSKGSLNIWSLDCDHQDAIISWILQINLCKTRWRFVFVIILSKLSIGMPCFI